MDYWSSLMASLGMSVDDESWVIVDCGEGGGAGGGGGDGVGGRLGR